MRFLFDRRQMTFFQCGDIRLMISANRDPRPLGGTIIHFKVSEGKYEKLKEQGVEFLQVPHLEVKMPDHDLWMAFLKDPDGNVLA